MNKEIAIIGYGYWGKNLLRNFGDLVGESAIVVCDFDNDKLKEAKGSYPSIKITADLMDILSNKQIGAVAISTPAASHYQLAKKCILSGKDVFVEKPLSLTVDEGWELVKLSEREKRILMVGHLLEYHPAILKLKKLIDKGELGKISYIYSNRLNLGKIRREENILWSFAPHDISVILFLLNEMPVSVSAHGGNYLHKDIADVTISTLEFASGSKGHIFVSWLHPFKEQKLIIVGDKKMAVFDDIIEKDKLLIYNHRIEWVDHIPIPRKENAEIINFTMSEPLKEECKHFLRCLKTGEKPRTDGYNGLRVLKILQACSSSLEKKGEVISLIPGHLGHAYDLRLEEQGNSNVYIHPTAVVDRPCDIGEGTKIWHYTHISRGAKIGNNCHLGQNVFVGSKAEIGNGVKIQNNVSVYDCVKLEDYVFCGPSMVFTNVINPRSHISRKNEFKKTLIRKGATLGANSTILCGITIGEYAFIGAGAVVTKDVAPYALVYGNPARLEGWMCQCGVKLEIKGQRGICKSCGKRYQRNKLSLITC
jgi:UDP-2-acetamido-3-amino-2,3-dideoxy-glucuronate N-acetyltransferase